MASDEDLEESFAGKLTNNYFDHAVMSTQQKLSSGIV